MKKGFTLIELLAVIVILAIIAVIAVPIVINIIEDTKKNALEQSLNMYKKALETTIAKEMMENNLEDGVYVIDKEGNIIYKNRTIKVEIKNYEFESGIVEIKEGNVKSLNLVSNNNIVVDVVDQTFDVWDGSIKEVTPDSDGNYHITKTSELAWLAQQVNNGTKFEGVNFYLENNLDLNNIEWVPIGTTTNKFWGNFYGNNHTIKNMYINKKESIAQGLFGDVTGVIDSLIIKDSSIVAQRGSGILSGISRKTANISDIIIYNSKVKSLEDTAGGIIGQFHGVGNNLKVINARIEAIQNVGGIIGKTATSGLEIKKLNNCYLDSSTYIYASGKLDQSLGYDVGVVGGVVGYACTLNVDNSISYATIESSCSHVGGIAGQIKDSSVVKNAKIYGKIKGKKVVGGISGNASTSTISNCEVYGDITSEEIPTFGALTGTSNSSQLIGNIVSSKLNNIQITLNNLMGNNDANTILENNLIK